MVWTDDPGPGETQTLAKLAAALPEAIPYGPTETVVTGLAEHSAHVRPGFLFACLPGLHHDGHRFAHEAVAMGARALLSERRVPTDPQVAQLVVPDARRALALVARAWHGAPDRALQVLAVTGTNGKTTTCFMLEAIFAAAGRPIGRLGTAGHQVGGRALDASLTTPGSLQLYGLLAQVADSGCRGVVLEASSHALSQHRLAGLAVDTAIFTNLTRDHLDYHGNPMAYLSAKMRLFAPRQEGKSYPALAVVPADSGVGRRVAAESVPHRHVITYGFSAHADVQGHHQRLPNGREVLDIAGAWGQGQLPLPLPGRHNALNALAAAAAALGNGISMASVRAGLARMAGVPGRFERVDGGTGPTVIVDFAHNPSGLREALRAARRICRGRLHLVFGCKGGDVDDEKRMRMGTVAARLADEVYVTTDDPYDEPPLETARLALSAMAAEGASHRWIADRQAAIALAIAEAEPGDLVLVAGRGHEQVQRVCGRDIPMDDRALCREALAARLRAGHLPAVAGSLP